MLLCAATEYEEMRETVSNLEEGGWDIPVAANRGMKWGITGELTWSDGADRMHVPTRQLHQPVSRVS